MPMIVLRKFWSATRLLREKRWSDAVDLTRIRVADLYLARRPVPSEPARRARLLAATLNRRGGLSTVPVDAGDLAGTRDAVLKPYLRHRFAAAASGRRRRMEPALILFRAEIRQVSGGGAAFRAFPEWPRGPAPSRLEPGPFPSMRAGPLLTGRRCAPAATI